LKKDIYAGITLGILVGGVIGLSIAQVTGIILAALASLLTAFFGLRPNKEGEVGNQIIIGTFSIACIIAILGGLYVRSNDSFSPSLQKDISMYQEAKFTPQEIKQIILVKKFGLIPNGFSFNLDAKSKGSSLMAGEDSLCKKISNNSNIDDIKSAFNNSGGKYQRVKDDLSILIADNTELKKILLAIKDLICEQ